jgi:Mitochondrial ribosomal protein mL59
LHMPTTNNTNTSFGKPISTVFFPFQNPFKPSRDPRTGKFHGPRYSLRRQADIIKLAMRFGVTELLPPSTKINRLMYGKKRPMAGTLKPKGSYEDRTRDTYVEKKQKNIEEALQVVAMRRMVTYPGIFMLIGFSGGISRRVVNQNQIPHGIHKNDISDRYLRKMHCAIVSLSLAVIFRIVARFSMIILLMGTSFVHNVLLLN